MPGSGLHPLLHAEGHSGQRQASVGVGVQSPLPCRAASGERPLGWGGGLLNPHPHLPTITQQLSTSSLSRKSPPDYILPKENVSMATSVLFP